MRALNASTVAAAISKSSSIGRREVPAPSGSVSADAPPASLKRAPRTHGPAQRGAVARAAPWDPVTTTDPRSAARTSALESHSQTAAPAAPAGSASVRASLAWEGETAGRGAACMRSAQARAGSPTAQPSAAAAALTWLMRPRWATSAPSPMRAEAPSTVAAGIPSPASAASAPIPAASLPSPASCRITPRSCARSATWAQ